MAVSTTIDVQFSDNFTEPSKKAFTLFKQNAQIIRQSLESVGKVTAAFRDLKTVEITVRVRDEATSQAQRIRNRMEQVFESPIVQQVRVAQLSGSTLSSLPSSALPQGSGGSSSGLKPSLRSNIPVRSFATGIDRVPDNMLAVIHKDEAVLNRREAETFRSGSGVSVNSLNIHFTNSPDLTRQGARRLARMIHDELKIVERRSSS